MEQYQSNNSHASHYYNSIPVIVLCISMMWGVLSKNIIGATILASLFLFGRLFLNNSIKLKIPKIAKSVFFILSTGGAAFFYFITAQEKGVFYATVISLPFFVLAPGLLDYIYKSDNVIRKEFKHIYQVRLNKSDKMLAIWEFPTTINFTTVFVYAYMLSLLCLLDGSNNLSLLPFIFISSSFLLILMFQNKSNYKISKQYTKQLSVWVLIFLSIIIPTELTWIKYEPEATKIILSISEQLYLDKLLNTSSYKEPNKSKTRIGNNGGVFDDSPDMDEIVIRVQFNNSKQTSKYLRSGIYNIFSPSINVWNGVDNDNQTLFPNAGGGFFSPFAKNMLDSTATIIYSFNNMPSGEVIPTPVGTQGIMNIEAETLMLDNEGIFIGQNIQHKQSYITNFSNTNQNISIAQPSPIDILYPQNLTKYFDKIILEAKINKSSDPKEMIISKLTDYFNTSYKYTLDLNNINSNRGRTLEEFMSTDKRGHCEFFATTTVLVLRYLGIPAKYATGFVVDEYIPEENMYWVRVKHGHAWTLAYYNNAWHDIDTTSNSMYTELHKESFKKTIKDFLNKLKYSISLMDFKQIISLILNKYLILPFVFIVLLFLFKYRNYNKRQNYFIYNKIINERLKKLKKDNIIKNDNETLLQFSKRIKSDHNIDITQDVLTYYSDIFGNKKHNK